MINIKSMLNYVHHAVSTGDPRFQRVDAIHMMDTKTGAKYHFYDWYSKISHGDKEITSHSLSKAENEILTAIRNMVVPKETPEEEDKRITKNITASREWLSSIYENPNPEPDTQEKNIVEEQGDEYKG